jgi:ELWxxDGT repeat protein
MLRDITPGPEDSTPRGGENSSDTLFFRASSPFGTELYRTNGTRVGTVLVEDIQPGPICSVPTSITDVWGNLFFAADDGSRGDELWLSGEPVQPIDIERLPSVNANNKADAAVLVRDFKQGKGYNTVIVKDGNTGKTISNAQFFNSTWRAHDLVTIDRGANSRVAVLATRDNGDIAVSQRDANDSQFRGKIDYFNRSWRALKAAEVPKVGATGIAVLAVKRDGQISVQTRKMNDGSLIRTTSYLSATAHAVTLAAVPDMNGNQRSEIAVLAMRGNGRPVVSIRDATSGKRIKDINLFGTSWRPLDLAVVDSVNGNSSPDIAVLAENASGKIAVEVRDGSTGAQLKRISYMSAKWVPHQLRALSDSNGNGAVELAVLARNDAGNIRAEVRDARSGNRIKSVNFLSTAFAPVAMAVLDDIKQTDADELALLAFRREGGDLRVQERDGGDGTLVRNTPIP